MIDVDYVERGIRERLRAHMPSKGLRAALLDSPLPELRQIIWAKISGEPIPKAIDPRFATHVANLYASKAAWTSIGVRRVFSPGHVARKRTLMLRKLDELRRWGMVMTKSFELTGMGRRYASGGSQRLL